jgi:peptidoglycan/xylan/chitin deacetylase (PgdA/CDA1 family)/quercetin dioxygenase-like cupin family protein
MAVRTVALTFEGGGDPQPLPAILEALAQTRTRATFFIDGRWAEANPELLRAIGEQGHEVGNHGYRHDDWTTMSDGEIESDLDATEQLVEGVLRASTRPWARPPYGALDERVIRVLARAGYSALYRDAVDGAHWPGETSPQAIVRRALRAAERERVVVLHTNRSDTATALPSLLGELEARRYKPVALSELDRSLTPRTERHPDFASLSIAPGSVQPRRAGRWRSLNLLELGAADAQPTGVPERAAQLDGCAVDLLTGPGDEPLEWQTDDHDRYVLVLAGALRCDFRDDGDELGHLVARAGDFFLCPGGSAHRLGPEHDRRWIAAVWCQAEAE